MNDEVIHAYALIGLRALAEYDFNEFKRSTDLTKGRLDDRINELLGQTHGQEREDLNRQLDQLESIRHESENQVAAAFLLRQISLACSQRAQALAVGYQREAELGVRESRRGIAEYAPSFHDRPSSRHDEYLRLGVMRLLQDFPQYSASFEYKWRDTRIDCVLMSLDDEDPPLLIEFKLRLDTRRQLDEAFRQLRRVGTGWAKSTVFVVLTVDSDSEIVDSQKEQTDFGLGARAVLLIYDPERNEFSRQGVERLFHTLPRR